MGIGRRSSGRDLVFRMACVKTTFLVKGTGQKKPGEGLLHGLLLQGHWNPQQGVEYSPHYTPTGGLDGVSAN